MAIRSDDGVRVVTVGETLADSRLSIPRYQRPYSWTPATALQLLDDIHGACVHGAPSYVLGAVILHHDGERLDVVDGQQRLLTLSLITSLLRGKHDGTVQSGEAAESPLVAVRTSLARRIKALTSASDGTALASYVEGECWLIRVQTSDEDEAFRVFDSQNYRGKSLLPHDLLKAYHLREMDGKESEAMQAAVVEGWESVPDAELDRLFSTYLYRIRRWSQGLPAPRFTAHEIGLFKGVRPRDQDAPTARYHLAAQAAVPMLTAWRGSRELSAVQSRDANRTRFQLDAPIMTGRPFFEMVTFMLSELRQLRKESYEPEWEPYASTDEELHERLGQSRFRYVSELYLAAVLYYTNRFGEAEGGEARERLFRWAYAPRVRQQRVLYVTVDNLARQARSAFWTIRNATSPTELRQLTTLPVDSTADRDPGLASILARLESV